MPNIRVLYENQADSSSSLVASATSGTLVASNLLNDIKSSVHRGAGTTMRYTIKWGSLVTFNMAALMFNNFTSTATMRSRVFTNATDVADVDVPVTDTGAALCCAYAPFNMFKWGMMPLGVNAYRFAGFAHGRSFFAACQGRQLVIDVDDHNNTMGYLEVSRFVTGAYWEPECNPEYGAELGFDYKTQFRPSDAGDLRSIRRPKKRTMNINLAWLTSEADRLQFYEIMMNCGMDAPMFISLFPEDASPVREQQHQLYAKIAGNSKWSHPKYGTMAAPMAVAEV